MGQVLHRSATTTAAVRRALQHSQESLRTLARRHGINPKTVVKWRKRDSTADYPRWTATGRSAGSTRATPSASSTSIWPRCAPPRANSISSWPSIELPSWLWSNSWRRPTCELPPPPGSTHRGCSLPYPHSAHRQWHPVRRPSEESPGANRPLPRPSLRSISSSCFFLFLDR
ncbi:hypothetical protein BDD14_6416 [Edaphobacter modestus]|uniref:Uncharacterized protein n=1 Tax=Edaphobacter modestus TaxID=388466 RepID=A0A4Q7XZD2_9BACT|nr:hypothetical protein BDD14_6416 [Edaphobacter modestus]